MLEESRMIALGTLLQEMSGVPFVWQYQSKKIPDVDLFISGKLVDVSDNRRPEVIYSPTGNPVPEKGATQTHRTIDDYMLYLQATGNGANHLLKNVKLKMWFPTNIATLKGETIGAAPIMGTPVQNITELRGGDYAERGSVDILLRTFTYISEDIYNIEEVPDFPPMGEYKSFYEGGTAKYPFAESDFVASGDVVISDSEILINDISSIVYDSGIKMSDVDTIEFNYSIGLGPYSRPLAQNIYIGGHQNFKVSVANGGIWANAEGVFYPGVSGYPIPDTPGSVSVLISVVANTFTVSNSWGAPEITGPLGASIGSADCTVELGNSYTPSLIELEKLRIVGKDLPNMIV